jgi:hypothetical protein
MTPNSSEDDVYFYDEDGSKKYLEDDTELMRVYNFGYIKGFVEAKRKYKSQGVNNMKILKLTESTGKALYINFDMVIFFTKYDQDTLIKLFDYEFIYVKETEEEIADLLSVTN